MKNCPARGILDFYYTNVVGPRARDLFMVKSWSDRGPGPFVRQKGGRSKAQPTFCDEVFAGLRAGDIFAKKRVLSRGPGSFYGET